MTACICGGNLDFFRTADGTGYVCDRANDDPTGDHRFPGDTRTTLEDRP